MSQAYDSVRALIDRDLAGEISLYGAQILCGEIDRLRAENDVLRGKGGEGMTTQAIAFLGYASLEDWLCAVDRSRPVAAMQVTVSPTTPLEPCVETVEVRLAQYDGQGVVHYCLLRAAGYTVLRGKPMGESEERIAAAAGGLWELVEDYLQELGVVYSRAAFAVPSNLVLLRAQAERFRFDSKAFRWMRSKEGRST